MVAAGSAIGLQNGDAFLFIAPAIWAVLALLVQQLADLGCAAEARKRVHSVLAVVSPYYQIATATEAARSNQYRSPWTRIAMIVVLVTAASAASFLGFREVSTDTPIFWGYTFCLLVSFALFVLSVKEGREVHQHLGNAYRSLGLHDLDGDD